MNADVIAQFEDVLKANGLDIKDPIKPDAGIVRVAPLGKRSKDAWYSFHSDFPQSGSFGDWSRGLHETWTVKTKESLTDEQKTELKKRIAADKKRRQREDERRREMGRARAKRMWNRSKASPDLQPYLRLKKIKALPGTRALGNMLVIPVQHDDVLMGVQFIKPDGVKRFSKWTHKSGSYFLAGEVTRDVVICEGYATAASIHHATGLPVMVAFDCHNLKPVAKHARKIWPNVRIIIAADDDQWTEGNPGMNCAREAVNTVRASFRRPAFREGTEGKPTDFNDLDQIEGDVEVRHQIEFGRPSYAEVKDLVNRSQVSRTIFFEPLPDQMPGKKPLATIRNLSEICRRSGVVVRYDVIRKDEEILVPGESFSLDNAANASLAFLTDLCVQFQMPVGHIAGSVTYLADENQFNPVATWITSKPWDGLSRLPDLYATIVAHGEDNPLIAQKVHDLKATLIRRWMISAVAAAFLPQGVGARGVLVFQGMQRKGKTSWFLKLAPKEMNLIAEGLTLEPHSRDSVMQALSCWIVELGELNATFDKAHMEQLKAFLSRSRDKIRTPYAKRDKTFPRRTIFFGSVNPDEFLIDPTGNSRFWTIKCDMIDYTHDLDIQQVWAEIYENHFLRDEPWHLTDDENKALDESNRQFEVTDSIEEKLRAYYDWPDDNDTANLGVGGQWFTITQLCVSLGYEKPTTGEVRRTGNAVRKLNGNLHKKPGNTKLFWVPVAHIKR